MRSALDRNDRGLAVEVALSSGEIEFGTLAASPCSARISSPEDRRLLEAAASQIAVYLERARLDAEIAAARLDAERSQARAALFSSVTHDLRTPLASIKTSVTSLLQVEVRFDPAQAGSCCRRSSRRPTGSTGWWATSSGSRRALRRLATGEGAHGARRGRRVRPPPPRADARRGPSGRSSVTPRTSPDPVLIDQACRTCSRTRSVSRPAREVTVSVAPWRSGVQVRVADQGPGSRRRIASACSTRSRNSGRVPRTRRAAAVSAAISRATCWRTAAGSDRGHPGGGTAVVFELPARAARSPRKRRPGWQVLDARARRRRRAADPTRDADQPGGARLRGAHRRHGGGGRGRGGGGRSRARPARSRSPDLDGTEVIRRVRSFSEVPIIVLSVRDRQVDKVAALYGADDYVTKPFGVEEVLARLRAAPAVARRANRLPLLRSARSRSTSVADSFRSGRSPSISRRPSTRCSRRSSRTRGSCSPTSGSSARWGPGTRRRAITSACTFARSAASSGTRRRHPRLILTEPGVGYRWIAGTDRGRPVVASPFDVDHDHAVGPQALLGRAFTSHQLEHTPLPKTLALPVFASTRSRRSRTRRARSSSSSRS